LRAGVGRGAAWVEQDYLRRIVLRERDRPGGLAVGLIDQTVRYALDGGYHVILEGILHRAKYGPMLERLQQCHRGRTWFFYFDVSFEETIRRHATRPQATEFTPEQMAGWYDARDVLDLPDEYVIPQSSTLDETVAFIAATAGLALDRRHADPPLPQTATENAAAPTT
jgi:hypothetical protein